MKWGELLYQVTSTSQEIRARIVHDTLLPFVEGAKELSLDDCKGIIGVTFGSVMGYVHDRATRELFERVCVPAPRLCASFVGQALVASCRSLDSF